MHVYPAHLTDCPWCALDIKALSILLISAKRSLPPAVICAGESLGDGDGVSSTASIAMPLPDHFQPTGRPLPLGLLRANTSF